jgi:hypothetical protein
MIFKNFSTVKVKFSNEKENFPDKDQENSE